MVDNDTGVQGRTPESTKTLSSPSSPAWPVALSVLAIIAASLPVFLVGAFAVFVRPDLGLSRSEYGFALAAFFAAVSAASVPGGYVAERFGAGLVMASACIVSSASLLAIATVVASPLSLAFSLALAGIATGMVSPATNVLLAADVREAQLGRAFGVKQAAVPGATVFAGALVPMVKIRGGWAEIFLAAGLTTVWLAPLIVLTLRRKAAVTRVSRALEPATVRWTPLWLMALSATSAVAAANALATHFVDATVGSGLDPGVAGYLLSFGGVSAIAMRIGWGWVADRFTCRPISIISCCQFVGAFGLLLLAGGAGNIAVVTLGVLMAFGLGWGWTGLFHLAIVRHYAAAAGKASGIAFLGISAGGIVGPAAFGLVADGLGLRVAWLTMAAMMAFGGLIAAMAKAMMAPRPMCS